MSDSKVREIMVDIVNSQDFTAQISIFGSMADPKANTVNTHTLYAWNTTGQSYVGITVFQIQYRKVGTVAYTTLTMRVPTDFLNAVLILNQQNIGTFWYDVPTKRIFIASDTYQYNQLSIA